MSRRTMLLLYQVLTGVSDTSTGIMLIVAPALTLRLMRVPAVPVSLPFVSYVGVFVLSIGIACLYGVTLLRSKTLARLETVWLLTAVTRGLVALYVAVQVATGGFDSGWAIVAVTDGLFAMLQAVGLMRGWLPNVLR